MNTEALLQLAAKWEQKAEPPSVEDGSEEAKCERAASMGHRTGLRACAEELRLLMKLLG